MNKAANIDEEIKPVDCESCEIDEEKKEGCTTDCETRLKRMKIQFIVTTTIFIILGILSFLCKG